MNYDSMKSLALFCVALTNLFIFFLLRNVAVSKNNIGQYNKLDHEYYEYDVRLDTGGTPYVSPKCLS